MISSKLIREVALGIMLFGGLASAAQANLITNGTFDTDLDDWDISVSSGTSGVTFDNGTAHVGRPGTPGIVDFSQLFSLETTTSAVEISFDYQWQINKPQLTDTFEAYFTYSQPGPSAVSSFFLSQTSDAADFGTTINFSTVLNVANVADLGGSNNAQIAFRLTENNQTAGTRVQVDNVMVNAVPVPAPATLALLGLGLAGLGYSRRKKS